MTETTGSLADAFLHASQALTAKMLDELMDRDPSMGEAVLKAYNSGERIALAFVMAADEPRIELESRSDYDTRRLIASIPLKIARPTLGGH